MRERYARHMAEILPPASKILLVTFDYPQEEMPGRRSRVSERGGGAVWPVCRDMFAGAGRCAGADPALQQRGVSRMEENIFLLTLR